MRDEINNQLQSHFDDRNDLVELFKIIWQHKWTITCFTAFISTVAVIYSLLLPNIFQSKTLLYSNDISGNISKISGYSGIAGLAGIKLPTGTDESNAIKAIKKLKSLSFFEQSILPNIFLPDLMAFESWDYKTNRLNYKKDVYNTNTNSWIREYAYPQKLIPSSQESFDKFTTKHFQLSEDQITGFITLSIKHQSPLIAKEWLELVVNQINLFYREKDKSEALKTINYLNEQIEMTNLTEVRQAISTLLKEETQKLALVEAKENYVFDYIDPPVVMEEKSEPKRALISILGFMFGGILGIFYVFLRYYYLRDEAF